MYICIFNKRNYIQKPPENWVGIMWEEIVTWWLILISSLILPIDERFLANFLSYKIKILITSESYWGNSMIHYTKNLVECQVHRRNSVTHYSFYNYKIITLL